MGKADGDCTKATGIPATKGGKAKAVNRNGRGTAGDLCGVEAAIPLTFQHGVCRRFELLKIPCFKKRYLK